jgi:hypothetical protein
MTKVEAIVNVIQDNDGIANWSIIYNEIEKYYPAIKKSKKWTAGVRGVLYREIKNNKNFKKIDEGIFALIDYDESLLILDEDKKDTETSNIIKIRKGQDKFRKKLLEKIKRCPITKITDERLLLASHIKPWAKSNNEERLDINNGLILSPLFDKLFDNGLITFSFQSELIISNSLKPKNIERIGIKNKHKFIDLPIKGREQYLEYHHNKIFLKV